MKKQEIKAWAITILIFAIVFVIGNYFGTELEKTIW
jgi:hypothetical protein